MRDLKTIIARLSVDLPVTDEEREAVHEHLAKCLKRQHYGMIVLISLAVFLTLLIIILGV